MSENITPVKEVNQDLVATLPAISRRLGVTLKQLKRFISSSRIEMDISSEDSLYSIQRVVDILEDMDDNERSNFRSLQKSQNASSSLYKGKFASLEKWSPSSDSKQEQPNRRKKVSEHPWIPESLKENSSEICDIKPADLAKMSNFSSPMTAKQVSLALGLPVKLASEAIYGSGYPTTQLKNLLVVDLRRDQLGSFVANLPDGLREKVILFQRNRGNKLSRQRTAELLNLNEESVVKLLNSLPGSPAHLTEEGLEYVRELPQFSSALLTLDAEIKASREEKTGRKKSRKRRSKKLSISKLAEHYGLTEETAVMLAKRELFPQYDSTAKTVHESSTRIPEKFIYEMVDENCYTLFSMAKELQIDHRKLERELLKNKIFPVSSYMLKDSSFIHKVIIYSERTVHSFRRSEQYRTLLEQETANRNASNRSGVQPEKKADAEYIRSIEDRVIVDARERTSSPKKAVFYVGPTNSGKTYHSLSELFAEYEQNSGRGLYVYAGPLRMLAFEVYEKMVERYGEDAVGFLTGEEQINPNANMLACTVEMAPDEGTSLVLDEAHWIVDSDRGQHWTHLLVAGRYTNMHILTAKEALAPLEELVSDSENISTREFQRRTPIFYNGEITLKQIPPRTAVVAFSRRSVYAIAGELARAGKKVGVLYGALPLQVRKAQIEKYVEGVYDIMVTTDVIGHGINLPIDNVVFAQTEKFDGRERRQIHIWEAAQIAGRAGRFGLSAGGNVYGLKGKSWYSTNYALMSNGTLAAGGMIETDLNATDAILFPRFSDLKVENSSEFPTAVVSWQQKAYALMQERPITPSDLSTEYKLFERVAEIADIPKEEPVKDWQGISPNTVWQLMSGPFNVKGNVITATTKWLLEDNPETSDSLEKYFERLIIPVIKTLESGKGLHKDQVSLFENISSDIGELKMVNIMFEGAGTLRLSELEEYQSIIDGFLIHSLSAAVKGSKFGKCEKCRKSCSPWFSLCDRCSFEKSWW